MRLILTLNILTVFMVQNSSSFSHQSLIDLQEGNDASPGVNPDRPFFDTTFFAPIPRTEPEVKKESDVDPEVDPESNPNPNPDVPGQPDIPTNPDLPNEPNEPEVETGPVPEPEEPEVKPTPPTKPDLPPTNPPQNVAPIPHPNLRPTVQPVPQPVPQPQPTVDNKPSTPYTPPVQYPSPPSVTIETRSASYVGEWGAATESCEYLSPNVFFNCHDGGILTVFDTVNAICKKLSDDFIQCRQEELWFDSYVEFQCTGIKRSHLMVTANVGPSPAWNCLKDGNAVKYLTLSRTCYDQNGYEYLDKHPKCGTGKPYTQADTDYCASAAVCKFQGDACYKLDLESVTMTNDSKDLKCSKSDITRDLQHYNFVASHLRSVNQVDWRFSGMGRGCQWESSPLILKCANGGQIDFLATYPFCRKYPENNMAMCQSFAPYSVENEETAGLLVSCTGKNEDQLILSVEIPSEYLNSRCKPDGLAVQSIMLSRGCGAYGTSEFEFINDKKFCNSPDQVFDLEDGRTYCFAGDTCQHPNGCDKVQIAPISADTGTDTVGHCIYAV